MKKYLVVLLSVLAIVAFATSSFARHQVVDQFEYTPQIVKSSKAMITLGGEIRIRGEISDNNEDFRETEDDITDGNCGFDHDNDPLTPLRSNDCRDDEAQYNQRVRLNLKATVSPNTMAFVELESGGDTSDTFTWGGTDMNWGATGYPKSNSKRGTLAIRQAYIAHQGSGLLGIPAGFKAGHMLLALGNGLFYDHSKFGDDALLFWIAPVDGLEVSMIAIKHDEGESIFESSDTDAYVIAAEGGMGGVNFSGDVTYLVDNDFFSEGTAGDGNVNATLWNIGLRADADVGPVNIYGDVEFQTGEAEKFKEAAAGGDDMEFGGWALLLGVAADINDMISVGGEFAYGSGDDIDTEDEYEGFINSLGAGQHYTYLYDQHARTAGQMMLDDSATLSSTYGNGDNSGLSNTWYLNVGADIKATPDLKVAADIYYLQASEKVRNDTATMDLEEKDIGVELDGKVTYQIDTNIVYYVEAGYLFAGDFYTNVTGDDGEIDDPWSVRHGLLISF